MFAETFYEIPCIICDVSKIIGHNIIKESKLYYEIALRNVNVS